MKRWTNLQQTSDTDIYYSNISEFIEQIDKFKFQLEPSISISLSQIMLAQLDQLDNPEEDNILDCVSELIIEASYKPKNLDTSKTFKDVTFNSVISQVCLDKSRQISDIKYLNDTQLKELANPILVQKLDTKEKDSIILELVQIVENLQQKVKSQQSQMDNLWDEIDNK